MMRRILTLLLFGCPAIFAQSSYLTCGKNAQGEAQCSATTSDHTTTCTTSPTGYMSCSTNDPAADAYYQQWRNQKLDAFIKKGMTKEQAEEALTDEIMMEDAGELKARHELCDQGKLKADRCDFSKPHPLGYKVPAPIYREATPEELADAVKAGKASHCLLYIFPDGAEVSMDDAKVGVSPIADIVIMKRDKPRKLTIKMAGYKTVEKQLDPDGKPIVLGVTLEKSGG